MSSEIGHALTGFAIYVLEKPRPRFVHREVIWAAWLACAAISPDIDYLLPALFPANHDHLRITHSLTAGLVLPSLTLLWLFWRGERGARLGTRGLQLLLASWSHIRFSKKLFRWCIWNNRYNRFAGS